MRILTWSACGRLLGMAVGFLGFYFVALRLFPPKNEIDSMILVIPFFLSACVVAIIGGWLGGGLLDRYGCARQRRQQNRNLTPVDKPPHAAKSDGSVVNGESPPPQ